MQKYHSATALRKPDFGYTVLHFSRATTVRPKLRVVASRTEEDSSTLSYCHWVSDLQRKQTQPAFDPPCQTLKNQFKVKHAQGIRRLSHALYRLADRDNLVLLAFTLTVPGSGDEVAVACETCCRHAIRYLFLKLKSMNGGKAIDAVTVVERAQPENTLHAQGAFAILPKSQAYFTEEAFHDAWIGELEEQSRATGVNLFESADGVVHRRAHVYLEPVRNRVGYANYLSKGDTKTPLVLSDGRVISLHPWFDASKSVRQIANEQDISMHFEAADFASGLEIINHELVPLTAKLLSGSTLQWRSNYNLHLERETGVRCQIPPSAVGKVGLAFKRFQKKQLRHQLNEFQRPNVYIKLDVAGNLVLRVGHKRVATAPRRTRRSA
jgi:hypothetical protein